MVRINPNSNIRFKFNCNPNPGHHPNPTLVVGVCIGVGLGLLYQLGFGCIGVRTMINLNPKLTITQTLYPMPTLH